MRAKTRRILYVDDDAENSFILETLLRISGYEPVTTNFASDALQLAQSESFDLFILSKRFPIGSGVYLCHKLHEIAPQTSILFLSEDADGLFHNGGQEYVISSGDAHDIVENVHHLIAESPETAAFASYT
jgi:DNA-binding response OmpR family regulator